MTRRTEQLPLTYERYTDIELNCDTLREVSFIHTVFEMTAGRRSDDLQIPVKGHHTVTKPNGNKGWAGPEIAGKWPY